jgi:hypothetical protein
MIHFRAPKDYNYIGLNATLTIIQVPYVKLQLFIIYHHTKILLAVRVLFCYCLSHFTRLLDSSDALADRFAKNSVSVTRVAHSHCINSLEHVLTWRLELFIWSRNSLLLRNPKVRRRVDTSRPFGSILSNLTLDQTLNTLFL